MMPAAIAQFLNKLDPGVPFVRNLNFVPVRKAKLLFDHPHSYREWDIIAGPDRDGFYVLRSSVRLDQFECTVFTLCLHESQFEEVQP